MSINHLYHIWFERIAQLRPSEHKARMRNMVWLLVGMYQSKSVHYEQGSGEDSMGEVHAAWWGTTVEPTAGQSQAASAGLA